MSVGSPPPTRGTQLPDGNFLAVARITPAYAGNTFSKKPTKSDIEDHPRLRGEHRRLFS